MKLELESLHGLTLHYRDCHYRDKRRGVKFADHRMVYAFQIESKGAEAQLKLTTR